LKLVAFTKDGIRKKIDATLERIPRTNEMKILHLKFFDNNHSIRISYFQYTKNYSLAIIIFRGMI